MLILFFKQGQQFLGLHKTCSILDLDAVPLKPDTKSQIPGHIDKSRRQIVFRTNIVMVYLRGPWVNNMT